MWMRPDGPIAQPLFPERIGLDGYQIATFPARASVALEPNGSGPDLCRRCRSVTRCPGRDWTEPSGFIHGGLDFQAAEARSRAENGTGLFGEVIAFA
jgi:hypothetical protein